MADVPTKEQRSYNMSRIRSTKAKPEMLVRKFLYAQGFRYKLHGLTPRPSPTEERRKQLPGKPDIVLPKYKTVIFIHGCFWHGHTNCLYFKVPQTSSEWWVQKINMNKDNDAKAVKALKKEGWKIIIVWECDLKPAKAAATLQKLVRRLKK